MEFLKILLLWCLFCVCYCDQEGNDTVTDSDLEDVTNSTDIWTSVDDNDSSSTTLPDIIITRPATKDISDTTMKDESSSSDSITTPDLTTPKEKEENFSACATNPCKNGGVCLEDPFDARVYHCTCLSGFTGNRCGVKDNCAADENVVCKNGYCSYSEDGLERSCKCFFGMFWDDIKQECKNPEPPCFPNPCHNGGACTIYQNEDFKCDCLEKYEGRTCEVENQCGEGDHCPGGQCETIEHLKMCTCSEGKYWNESTRHCEAAEPPCIPNPCENESKCQALSNGDYECSCTIYNVGENCEIDNLCYSRDGNISLCGGKGSCRISERPPVCECYKGYYFNTEMRTCRENVPPCIPNPCANDGLCIPIGDHFNCSCSEGYTGELCKDPDFCVLQGGHAVCGDASCKSNNELGTFHCFCDEGFYFDFSKRTCMEVDFCPIMTCGMNEECDNSKCVCKKNFERNNTTSKCEGNFCASNPCPSDDMMCTQGAGISDYYCSCKEGYSLNGARCAEVACVIPALNQCGQKCEPSEDGYTCKCDAEYFTLKEDIKTCINIENTTCSNKTCEKGQCFKDDNGEETCVCPPGYIEVDGTCIDLCKSDKLPNGICPDNKCESTNDGFKCKCEGKYKLSVDKLTCTNRRMCEIGEVGATACAARNAICIEDWNSHLGYICQCIFPQKESSQGICQDICSNEENQRNCSTLGARCDVDANGEMQCKCPPLYKQAENGEMCSQLADVSYLLTMPLDLDSYRIGHAKRQRSLETEYPADYFQIQYDAGKTFSKIFPGLTQLNVINCKKNVNYYLCKMELQFSSITNEDLKRIEMPDICLPSDDSSDKCIIPPSLISRKNRLKSDLTIKKTDPCDTEVKEQLCGSETVCSSSHSKTSFNCTCNEGFEKRSIIFPFQDSDSFIETCNDINECLVEGVCPQHTKCENLIGSYTCSCIPGYRIKDKSKDPKVDGCVEICNPNPCDHGSCDAIDDADFACRCEAGFTGLLCDLTDSNFKRAQTNTIIVGAVLGGVLLITLIIFFVTIQRLKKKKSDEPDHMLYAAEMNERREGAVNNAYQ